MGSNTLTMTTVSLVEDDASFSLLLARDLSRCKSIDIISVHSDAEEALQELPHRKPDVVLMDIKLPGMSGIDCLRRLKRMNPPLLCHVLMLTGHEDSSLVFEALKAGASGYLLKDRISVRELTTAINSVESGGAVMSPSIALKVVRYFEEPSMPFSGLSEREWEVLTSLSHGLMYKEIAHQLSISLDTVRKHLGAIFRKLHVRSRTDAVRHYLQRPH